MKYQRLVSSTTPSSLQDWLEEELESRGIDGVYTRYILSLLQQDYLDLEPAECQHTTLTGHQRKKCDEFGCKDYVLSFSKARHQKWKNWEKERLLGLSTSCCGLDLSSNLEERNKIAAVECLKSASEQKFGIEKLIDEVCIKLKNVKSISEKARVEEEDSDHGEKEQEEIPPSSPNDPAEKYYEAFPALNGKTEPMTELCQQQRQQNKSDALEGAWNARLNKETVNQKVEQNESGGTLVTEKIVVAAYENENKTRTLQFKNCSLREFKIIDQEDEGEVKRKTAQPSFIVPKVKTSVVRKPFSTGYLPFNQLRKHAQDPISSKDADLSGSPELPVVPISKVLKEVNTAEESHHNNIVSGTGTSFPSKKDNEIKNAKEFIVNSEEARAFESLFENFCDCEKLGILMYAALTDVSNSDLCADEKDKFSVEQLLSKFNSSLASIWENNEHNTKKKDFVSVDNEQILKLAPDQPYKMMYDESVWACNREEIERKNKVKLLPSNASHISKILSSRENNELYSDVRNIKPLPRNERKFSNESLSKEVEPFMDSENKENSESTYSCKALLDASPEGSFNNVNENGTLGKTEDYVDSYPEQFSPGIENFDEARHLPNIGSERETASPKFDDINSASSAWKLQDTSHMLDQNLKKIWDPSPLGESSNWLALPVKNDVHHRTDWEGRDFFKLPSRSDVQAQWNQKCEQGEKGKVASLYKGKCTLTYHKGESKFVEVVPSHKQKSIVLEGKLDAIESGALFQSDSALSSISYLSDEEYEEEENLLTSPKTHFQPIRHDSLDTENSDDLEVMMLTHTAVGCSPVSQGSVVEYSYADLVPAMPPDKENSPKKYCHVELKKTRSKRISPKNFSANQLASPVKEVKRGRTISSSFDELASLTGHVSSHDYSGIEFATQSTNALNLLSFHFWKADNFKDKGTNTDTSLSIGIDSITTQHISCWKDSESVACLPEKDFSKEFYSPEIKIWNGCSEISKTPGRKHTVSKWKWSTNDDNNNMEELKCFPLSYSEWNGFGEAKNKTLLKAFGSSTDINALRQEIKEEEEELFRNISYLDSSSVKDIDNPSESRNCDFFLGRNGYENGKTVHKRDELFTDTAEESFLMHSSFLEWNSSDESFGEHVFRDFYDRSFSLGDLDMDDGEHPFPAVPADKILYSSDLEDEWHKTSHSFRIQAPHHKRNKYKYPPQKRPCSFYLEGNCRRSDCRFSHDLSTITCRFWEEGTCFKGITCPFLHGYICDTGFSERNNNTPDCKYTLESEADFPSLSSSKNVVSAEKSIIQEIALDKGNRPKRKKGKSQSSWNPKKATHQPVVSSSWPGCKSFLKTLESSPE